MRNIDSTHAQPGKHGKGRTRRGPQGPTLPIASLLLWLTVAGVGCTPVRVSVGWRFIRDKAPGLRLIRIAYYGRSSRTSPHCLNVCRVPCRASPHWHCTRSGRGLGRHTRGTVSDALCSGRTPPTRIMIFVLWNPLPRRGRQVFKGYLFFRGLLLKFVCGDVHGFFFLKCTPKCTLLGVQCTLFDSIR